MSNQTHNNDTAATIIKPKKKHGKKFLKVLAVILSVIVVLAALAATANAICVKNNKQRADSFDKVNTAADLTFENYSDGCWNIHSDREIKVMQLTDVHLGGGFMSTDNDAMALNAVAAMITAEKPDFVIATGDISYPVPFQAGTFNNQSGASLFAELMETLGVHWTLSYGNHDTEAYSYYSREQLTDFYSSGNYPHCLVQAGPDDVDGAGNQIFNVINSDGVITRSLIIFDSHSYVDGDIFGIKWSYDNIHDNQIEWYKNTVNTLSQQNKDAISKLSTDKAEQYKELTTVKSSVFMHIPLTEYKDAWNEYVDNERNNTANVTYNYGTAGESGEIVYCGIHGDNLFETMFELKSTDSMFCGHDHLNNFSLNYKGINLNYGMSIDYLAYSGIYKLGTQRGCTLIAIGTDGTAVSVNSNYYQDKYVSKYDKESVTMQDLDKKEA